MQICWYLAAVVQVQLCKYFIEIGDTSRESTVWGEINALRFAMMAYGNKSPIGSTSHLSPPFCTLRNADYAMLSLQHGKRSSSRGSCRRSSG